MVLLSNSIQLLCLHILFIISNNKSDRLNRNNQLKKIKRDQVWLQKRSGATGTAGTSATTKTIGVLALSDFADPYACVQECLRQMGVESSIASGSPNVFHAYDSIDKTHFTFILAPTTLKRDTFFALELTRAADIIMFVVCNDSLNEFSTVIDEVCTVCSWQYRPIITLCCLYTITDGFERHQCYEGDGLSRRLVLRAGRRKRHGRRSLQCQN